MCRDDKTKKTKLTVINNLSASHPYHQMILIEQRNIIRMISMFEGDKEYFMKDDLDVVILNLLENELCPLKTTELGAKMKGNQQEPRVLHPW